MKAARKSSRQVYKATITAQLRAVRKAEKILRGPPLDMANVQWMPASAGFKAWYTREELNAMSQLVTGVTNNSLKENACQDLSAGPAT